MTTIVCSLLNGSYKPLTSNLFTVLSTQLTSICHPPLWNGTYKSVNVFLKGKR